jgi:hypothetical protein
MTKKNRSGIERYARAGKTVPREKSSMQNCIQCSRAEETKISRGGDTFSRAGLNRKTIRLSLIDERTEDTGSGAWTEDRAGRSFDTGPAQGNQVL